MDMERVKFITASGVSRETLAGLDAYAALLVKWQASINLVGPKTMDDLWSRHFFDSLQLVDLIPSSAKSIVDLGSGAGFPGLVVALALSARKQDATVTLVESNGKKAAFLRVVAQALKLPAKVVNGRIEAEVLRLPAVDFITARALASLDQLFRWTAPLLKSGAVGLFHKGRDLDKELEEAAISWDIAYEKLPSVVADGSWIVRVAELRSKADNAK